MQQKNTKLNAIEMLEQQHRAVEALFEELAGGGLAGNEAKKTLLELADALDAHAAIEERHFYPAVRKGAEDELITEAYDDHREVKQLLLQILDANPSDEGFQEQIEELQAMVESHVEEEEAELFPRAQKALSADQLKELAALMQSAMTERQQEGDPRARVAEDVASEGASA
jgi:hemerythrin superfamily protein